MLSRFFITYKKFLWTSILCCGFIISCHGNIASGNPAFPGAEGEGANSVGGRGGDVYEVTSLDDSGPGSLRAAIEASGPRTVVFKVGGTIALLNPLIIRNPNITIAGQTAPGGGICLRDAGLAVSTNDVVVRFIRVRLGNDSLRDSDSISISKGKRIIFDHCSASWSTDETFSASTNEERLDDVTVQWTFITESLNNAIPGKGSHGYGSLIRGNRGAKYSFHHNLYAHHRGRSPRPGNYDDWSHDKDPQGFLLDFRNNVIYNFSGSYAGYNGDHESITKINYAGNCLIRGQNSGQSSVAYREQSIYNKGFFFNNAIDGIIPPDPFSLVRFPPEYTPAIAAAYKQNYPFSTDSVLTDSPQTAFTRVLADAGATLPERDAVDERVVQSIINRTGTIIDDESAVGGWPFLAAGTPPPDTDSDGMPDSWETERGLDSSDPANRNGDRNFDGYTNLEEYLNWLVRPVISCQSGIQSVTEGNLVEINLNRSGYTTSTLRVNLEIGGDAISGEDYEPLSSSVVFPKGQTEVVIRIQTLIDSRIENAEQVSLRILDHPDDYRTGDSDRLSVNILDNTNPDQVPTAVRNSTGHYR